MEMEIEMEMEMVGGGGNDFILLCHQSRFGRPRTDITNYSNGICWTCREEQKYCSPRSKDNQ